MELLNPLSIARANALYQRRTVKANCLITDSVGDCVYIRGADVAGIYQVEKAAPLDGALKMPAVGVLVAKSGSYDCTVQLFGEVFNLVSGLTPGKVLFVGEDGALTHTPPVATPFFPIAYIQSMGVAIGADKLWLVPSFSMTKRIG